jgi:hypothetical protein
MKPWRDTALNLRKLYGILVILAWSFPLARFATTANAQAISQKPKDQHTASLLDVTKAITSILQEVKSDPAFQHGPQLTQAEFDYQTVTTTTATGGLGIMGIVTLGASRARSITSETDFVYSLASSGAEEPAASIGGWIEKIKAFFARNDKQQILAQADKVLPAAIKQAAANLQSAPTLPNPSGNALTKRSYVITLAFSVTDDFNGGEDVSSLVVVAPKLSLDHSRGDVQTLKLTFADM